MKALTNAQLAQEIKAVRRSMNSIINKRFEKLLKEIEERLTGAGPGKKQAANSGTKKRSTKGYL